MSEEHATVDNSHVDEINEAIHSSIQLLEEQKQYALNIGATHIFMDNPRAAKIENGKLMIYVHQFESWCEAPKKLSWYEEKGLIKEIEFSKEDQYNG